MKYPQYQISSYYNPTMYIVENDETAHVVIGTENYDVRCYVYYKTEQEKLPKDTEIKLKITGATIPITVEHLTDSEVFIDRLESAIKTKPDKVIYDQNGFIRMMHKHPFRGGRDNWNVIAVMDSYKHNDVTSAIMILLHDAANNVQSYRTHKAANPYKFFVNTFDIMRFESIGEIIKKEPLIDIMVSMVLCDPHGDGMISGRV